MKGNTQVNFSGTNAAQNTVRMLVWLLAAIAFVTYANTLWNNFAYDDFLVIKENTFVAKGLQGIPDILTTPYHKGFNNAATELYRPLSLMVFATAHHLFGANPFVFHLLNALVFAGCVVALFLFLHRLLKRAKIAVAFIASLLFALHPIHTEVVANCKSLDELLCFLFAFTSLNLLLTYTETGKIKSLISGSLFYLFAFLSKETAVTFLAIIPFVFYVHAGNHKKRSHTILFSVLLMAVIAFAMRYMALGSYDTSITGISFIDNPLADKNLATASRLATAIYIMGKYLLLLIVPWPLVSDYSFNAIPFTTFSNPLVLLSLGAYVLLVVYSIMRLRKSATDMYVFAILFFLATISLVSNIPFLVGVNMAERFLFFPSVGFCIVTALLIDKIANQSSGLRSLISTKPMLIILPVCFIYAALTVIRNFAWKDNLTLYTADAENSPASCRLSFMLGNELVAAGNLVEGVSYLQNAVTIYPEYAAAQLELGKAMYTGRDFAEAAPHAQKAVQLLLNNVEAASSLGLIYLAQQRYDDAIVLFKNVLQREPSNVHAHFNLGACYANTKNFDLALTELKTTIALDARYAEYAPFQYIIRIYGKMGLADSAMAYTAKMRAVSGQ